MIDYTIVLGTAGIAAKGGSYRAIGEDIKRWADEECRLFPNSDACLEIELQVDTRGSLQSARHLLSRRDSAITLMKSEVVRDRSLTSLANYVKLQEITPMYEEEVHVLAVKGITDLRQLNDKKVVVGPQGLGSRITSEMILQQKNIEPGTLLDDDFPSGVCKVLLGEASAIFFAGAQPLPIYADLDKKLKGYSEILNSVHFLPVKNILTAQLDPAEIHKESYPWLEMNENINTVSSDAILVRYQFNPNGEKGRIRCEQFERLGRLLDKRLRNNNFSDSHAKWKEIKNTIMKLGVNLAEDFACH